MLMPMLRMFAPAFPLAKMFFYQSLTSTKQNAFTTAALSVPVANPLSADAYGMFGEVHLDPSKTYTIVLAPSTDSDPPTNPIFSIDGVQAVSARAVSVLSKTADYTVSVTDGDDVLLLVDASLGNVTVGLYTAVGHSGWHVTVIKTDASAYTVTVDPFGAQTINGFSTVALSGLNDGVSISSDNTNWVRPLERNSKTPTVFSPLSNHAPASAYATPDSRNAHPCLDFDGATDEEAIFLGVLPLGYSSGGLTVDTWWSFTTATAGSLRVQAAIERMDVSSLDITADSFAAFQSAGGTAPATSGMIIKVSVVFTNGAQMDSLAAGEMYRLKIRRDADGTSGTDDITTDAELLAVVCRET